MKIVRRSYLHFIMLLVLISLFALPAKAEDQLSIISLPEVDNNEYIKFEDDVLGKLIEQKYAGEVIIAQHIKQMYSFQGVGISNLRGLEHAYNMNVFEATNGNIEDLTPLQNWQTLYDLNLSSNKLTSITTLAETGKTVRQAVYRQQIVLANNNLTDLTPLKTWRFLKYLDVSNNAIKNIDVLKDLPYLSYLNIKGNPLTSADIEILKELVRRGVQVETDYPLYSDENILIYSKELEQILRKKLKITGDITAVDLQKLIHLDLSNTTITDLRGLEAATNLQTLNISNTRITDGTTIRYFRNLKSLIIAKTTITDLHWIADLPVLVELDASYLDITNVIGSSKSLEKVNLSYTRYPNLAYFTSNFEKLQELKLIGAYYPKEEYNYIQTLQKNNIKVHYTSIKTLTQKDTKLYLSLDNGEMVKTITSIELYSENNEWLYGSQYARYRFNNLPVFIDATGRSYIILPNIALAEDYSITLEIGSTIRSKQLIDLFVAEASLVVTTPKKLIGTLVNKWNEPLINHPILTAEGTIYTNTRGEFTYNTYLEAVSLYTIVNDIKVLLKTIDFTETSYAKVTQLGKFQLSVMTGTEKIHGTIMDANGKRIVGGQIRVETLEGKFVANTLMDSNGYFKVEGLRHGKYRLYVKDVTGLIVYQVIITQTTHIQQHLIVQFVGMGAWYGVGNRFISTQQHVAPGQQVFTQLRYRNNSNKRLTKVRIKLTQTASLDVIRQHVYLNGKKVKWLDDRTIELPELLPGESGKLSITAEVKEDHHQEDVSIKATLTSAEGEEQEYINEFTKVRVTLNAPAVTTTREVSLHGIATPGAKVIILVDGQAVGETIANTKWWTAKINVLGAADKKIEVQAKVESGGRTFYSTKKQVSYKPKNIKISNAKVTIARFDTPINPYVGIATSSIIILPGYRKTAQDMDFDITFDGEVTAPTLHFLNKTYPMVKDGKTNRYSGHIEGNWEEYTEQTIEVRYVVDGETYQLPLLLITPIIDPSGFVFEGSLENRLSDVKTLIEERKGQGWLQWNAARFAQVNPQQTDDEGRYGWDVPMGEWRVQFSKEGYYPYSSRVVPVPPPETELNVPLIAKNPLFASVEKLNKDTIKVNFNRPIKEANIKKYITVTDELTKEPVATTLTLQHWAGYKEVTKGVFEEDEAQSLSKEIILKLPKGTIATQNFIVKLMDNIEDYRGEKLSQTQMFTTGQKVIAKNQLLKINFSNDFNLDKAKNYVKVQNLLGEILPVRFTKVNHTLHIHPPLGGYDEGSYQLIIDHDFTSNKGQKIHNNYITPLTVK